LPQHAAVIYITIVADMDGASAPYAFRATAVSRFMFKSKIRPR
jgi:hypothetical protein